MPTSSAPSGSCAVARIAAPAVVRVRNSSSADHRRRRGDQQDQPMRRHRQPEQRDDLAIRRVHVAELRAPDVLGHGFEEQHHAERGNHRIERRGVPQRTEHQPFERRAGHGQRRHRHGHRRPVVEARLHHQRVGQVRAEHEQLAVREVGHVHGAEDQRQAERDQAVDAAGDEAVEDLLRQEFHRLTGSSGPATRRRSTASPIRRARRACSMSPARRPRRRRRAAACSGRARANRSAAAREIAPC